MFTFPLISQTNITKVSHLLQLNKMDLKTNLIEEYVNFFDTTKKRNKKLRICTIILFILKIIGVFWYLNEYSFFKGNK